MPAPACHQKRLRKRPDGRRRRRRGFWEEDRGRERREGWRRARINRRRLAASLPVFSLSLPKAEAEKAVTGCLGHGRFASFSLVTGLPPKRPRRGARRRELLLTRSGDGAPRSG
jgi:hypothetical protein